MLVLRGDLLVQGGNELSIKARYIFISILKYLAWSSIFIIFFAYINSVIRQDIRLEIEYYIKNSFLCFFGIEIVDKSSVLYYIEHIVSSVFGFVYSAIIVKNFLSPKNPIRFAKAFVVDSDEKKVLFRYWIQFDKGVYLYNVLIKLDILEFKETIKGMGKGNVLFHFEEYYELIRGVRYLQVPINYPKWLSSLMKVTENTERPSDVIIRIILTGIDGEGNKFSKMKYYSVIDMYNGYQFVSIRKSEYDKKWYEENGIEYLRYNHFELMCKCANNPLKCLQYKYINMSNNKIKGEKLLENLYKLRHKIYRK